MDDKQYVKKSEEQFRSWTERLKKDLSFAKDGAVDPKQYFDPSNRPRIVFLMKEVNDDPFKPQNLSPYLFKGGEGNSWNNVVRWADTLQAGLGRSADRIPLGAQVTNDDRVRILQTIAVVNLKKLPGSGASDAATINAHAEHFSKALEQQLILLDPHVIVVAGVELGWNNELKAILPEGTIWNWKAWQGRNRLLIKTCHPQARNGKPEESLTRIEQAISGIHEAGVWPAL